MTPTTLTSNTTDMNTEKKTVAERLAEVKRTIAELTAIVDADQLILRPAQLNKLTVDEFAELMDLLPDAQPSRGYRCYECHVKVDGVFMAVASATGTLVDVSRNSDQVRAELKSLRNAA